MHIRRKWFAFAVAIAVLPIGNTALAQLKVGYTDAQLIVAQMSEYRETLQQLLQGERILPQ